MLIRCPECRFERQIDENAIPANAAMATCPHCQYRFRFRNPDGTPVVDE
ncbi:MAG: zinc-ribbon domain-containing protein, partial [Bilophila sp.]|nr:zinc-ribbon domain-containing protein [Bilophila sp.]